MPIPVPRLDDRGYDDLLAELIARIPGHTPEWTDPRPGDPGRSILELLAWLADTILYRANLIPERQRLAFLRLLDLPPRPALPATGLVAVSAGKALGAPELAPGSPVQGPRPFQTCDELCVLPVEGAWFIKRRPTEPERAALADLLPGLDGLYRRRLDRNARLTHYVTAQVFQAPVPGDGLDVLAESIDRCLWLALLAPEGVPPTAHPAIREALGRQPARALNLGLVPALRSQAPAAEPVPIPVTWSISTGRWTAPGSPEYLALATMADTTGGLTTAGTLRLVLPDSGLIGVPVDATDPLLSAGVGARPPRLDDEALAARCIAWIRLQPDRRTRSLPLAWAVLNAVRVEQTVTRTGLVVATADGSPDQSVALGTPDVQAEGFACAVEEPGRGFVPWNLVDDLGGAGRDDRVVVLDAAAGILRFGDGVRGRIPAAGARIQLLHCRVGGGAAGNLPPGSLTAIAGATVPLSVTQALATEGGQDAETLAEAERRIAGLLSHGDRAVTVDDYRRLALATPALRLGRVEVLPRFKPQQRDDDVPGVVSVMVLPAATRPGAPNPRPDRRTLERVHAHLDRRRVLGAELYVMGVDYVPMGVSVAVTVADGANRDATLRAVQDALTAYLAPLAPGGRDGGGWPLGESVREAELEVVAARVARVGTVAGVRIFRRRTDQAFELCPRDPHGHTRLDLRRWQLPELTAVLVEEGETVAEDGRRLGGGATVDDLGAIGIPVIPEIC